MQVMAAINEPGTDKTRRSASFGSERNAVDYCVTAWKKRPFIVGGGMQLRMILEESAFDDDEVRKAKEAAKDGEFDGLK